MPSKEVLEAFNTIPLGWFPELDFYRAAGEVICSICKKEYRKHDDYPLYPFLVIICNGDLVKL